MPTVILRTDEETRDQLKAVATIRKTTIIALLREFADAEAAQTREDYPQMWELVYESGRMRDSLGSHSAIGG